VIASNNDSFHRPDDVPRCYRAEAPAKVNLTLDVLARRADGFHELRSLVIGVGLYDTLSCTLAPRNSFTIQCNDDSLATPGNLAIRAARALADAIPESGGLSIDLFKRIPAGGGLGGGSSDAATVLQSFNRLLGNPMLPSMLAKVGAEIGSDVPVFFGLPCARMTGRGEKVKPAQLFWRGYALLVYPGIHIPTADVYAAWTPSDGGNAAEGAEESLLRAKNAVEMARYLTNQLEPAVFRISPALCELAEQLSKVGCGEFRVSGSGSTLFGLFDETKEAERAATTIAERFSNVKTSVVAAPVGMNPLASEDE